MCRRMTYEEHIYNYPLFSFKRFPIFIRYCKPVAKTIAAMTGRTWIIILADMVWCNFRYGAMDSRDYLLFEFWKKSASERNTFFTKRRYFRLIKTFDENTFCHPDGKAYLYKKYAEFIKRDWILANNKTEVKLIKDFFDKHNRVLIKPLSSEQGRDIYVAKGKDLNEVARIIEECKKRPILLEEICTNCEELNRINSHSLNTIRVYSIVTKNGNIEIPSICLRCGCGDTIVDNWGAGGIGYPVDIKTGIVYAPGVDKKGNKHIYHPGTNIVMPGFVIPRFKEVCEMAKKAIQKDMKVVYAGHDIAILPDRLELIEVNFPGGHDLLQTLDQVGKYKIMQTVKR